MLEKLAHGKKNYYIPTYVYTYMTSKCLSVIRVYAQLTYIS